MKKIEAIIRKSGWGVGGGGGGGGVKGQGTAKQGLIFRGIAYDVNAIERIYLSFVVREVNVQKSIDAILKSAYTGESGDGRIFVSAIEQSIRIRTGDQGDESLYDKEQKNA